MFSLVSRCRSSSTLQSSNPNESTVTRSESRGDSDPGGGGRRGNDINRNRGPNNRGPNNRDPNNRGPNSSNRGPNPNYRGPNRGPGRGPPAGSMKLENPMKIQRVTHVPPPFPRDDDKDRPHPRHRKSPAGSASTRPKPGPVASVGGGSSSSELLERRSFDEGRYTQFRNGKRSHLFSVSFPFLYLEHEKIHCIHCDN
jgi:hypothetical protein